MNGSKTNWLKQALLDYLLGNASFTLPANYWVALSTEVFSLNATGSAMDEVPLANGYARVEIVNDPSTWSDAAVATDVTKASVIDVIFPSATGAWGLVKSAYLCDASTDGNAHWGANLTDPTTVAAGAAPTIPAGSWSFRDPADPATLGP